MERNAPRDTETAPMGDKDKRRKDALKAEDAFDRAAKRAAQRARRRRAQETPKR